MIILKNGYLLFVASRRTTCLCPTLTLFSVLIILSINQPQRNFFYAYAMLRNRIFLSLHTGEVRVNYGQNTDELRVKGIRFGGEKRDSGNKFESELLNEIWVRRLCICKNHFWLCFLLYLFQLIINKSQIKIANSLEISVSDLLKV